VTLPDDVVNAGHQAIRAVLSANGFPAVENADIQIEGGKKGAPAIVSVSPRSTGKGAAPNGFIERLAAAAEYVNPAIKLAAEAYRAEAEGDAEFLDRAIRTGEVEVAVLEGTREGSRVVRGLISLGHAVPRSSKDVPVGF
jgi:hypothetical protein